MQQFKNIEKEDNNFHVIQKNNQIIVEDVLPNQDKKKLVFNSFLNYKKPS